MFGCRMFRRNKQSFARLFVVFVCVCLILILFNSTKILSEEKNVDFIDVSSFRATEGRYDIAKEKVFTKTNIELFEEVISYGNDPVKTQDRPRPVDKQLTESYEKSTYVYQAKLRTTIKQLNKEQRVQNEERFPQRSSNSIVIVIQVHTRARYLIKLIQSLRDTRGISDALLIFSHDYFASDINSLVRSIDFCQVIQIFFPYSEQFYPNEFPGTDPEDCLRDTPKDKAMALGCNNAAHPDMYGHYREAQFTMTKHHWWWKANRVFHDLRSTRNHQGLVLFLEEDHYVSPDFYEVIQKAYLLKKASTECKEYGCDIITLGDYRKLSSFVDVGSDHVQVQPWKSTENNMGMAFDISTWNKLSKCRELFCSYDDYNWDWTLMKMSLVCFPKPLTVLLVKAPRVFHLGTCGLHHKTSNCNVEMVIADVKDIIERSEQGLYPESLVINVAEPWIQGGVSQPNGGWGDIRDHEMCMKFTESTEK